MSGKIVGCNTRNYLLEKTRVTSVPEDERNYHIFYQMLTGLGAAEKKARSLGVVGDYALLSQPGAGHLRHDRASAR